MTKPDFSFAAFCLWFVYFEVQFCFQSKFSFQREANFESKLTVAHFSRTNHNSLLRIAINEIASFCIGNGLRQMGFFYRIRQSGQGRLSGYGERF